MSEPLPVLSVTCAFPVEQSTDYGVIVEPELAATMPRYQPAGVTPKRAWKLELRDATPAERAHVHAIFDQVRGVAGRFLFTPPRAAAAARCRFERPELETTGASARRCAASLVIVED